MIDDQVVVLVTGVGDTVGQAVVKAARACSAPVRIVGTDADPHAVGLPWAARRGSPRRRAAVGGRPRNAATLQGTGRLRGPDHFHLP